MSTPSHDPVRVARLRVAFFAVLTVIALIAGWFLAGEIPDSPPPLPVATAPGQSLPSESSDASPATTESSVSRPAEDRAATIDIPLGFMPHLGASGDTEAILGEVEMASNAGFHHYLVRVQPPWPNVESSANPFEPLTAILERDESARFTLWVDLNPPAEWLEANPEAVYETTEGEHPFASTASTEWKGAAQAAIDRLFADASAAGLVERVAGLVPGALVDGQWHGPAGLDISTPMLEDFRQWLSLQYTNDAAFAAAWGENADEIAEAEFPALPERGEEPLVFYDLETDRPVLDALRHLSEARAGALVEIVEHIRVTRGSNLTILLPYGYSYELLDPTSGHMALNIAMDSSADGFISPVSYANRGLGSPGGFMGPVDSARYHGKRWYLIDDTRTGIERDSETGAFRPPDGVRIEDIYHVQARNFAAALTHNLGLFWSDANGRPTLHDPVMWERFAQMRSVYSGLESQRASNPIPNPRSRATVLFVVSESSRFVHRRDAPLAARLLQGARDAAMQAGGPAQFVLLRDVLAGRAAPAEVYVFANLFSLDESERERLHAVLQRDRATAIWLYAPGYFADGEASVENIAKTVRLPVGVHDGTAQAGSRWIIGGDWLSIDARLGEDLEVSPLFYIRDSAEGDEDEIEPMAVFRDSGHASIAASFSEDGWNSIFMADPVLNAPLLRTILGILEANSYIEAPDLPIVETTLFGPGIIALHAAEPGERTLRLPTTLNVFDVLDREQGWYNQQSILMRFDAGQTRILQIEAPDDAPAL